MIIFPSYGIRPCLWYHDVENLVARRQSRCSWRKPELIKRDATALSADFLTWGFKWFGKSAENLISQTENYPRNFPKEGKAWKPTTLHTQLHHCLFTKEFVHSSPGKSWRLPSLVCQPTRASTSCRAPKSNSIRKWNYSSLKERKRILYCPFGKRNLKYLVSTPVLCLTYSSLESGLHFINFRLPSLHKLSFFYIM